MITGTKSRSYSSRQFSKDGAYRTAQIYVLLPTWILSEAILAINVLCCAVAHVFYRRERHLGVGPHFEGSQQETLDDVLLLS